jgi:hypothetical protein
MTAFGANVTNGRPLSSNPPATSPKDHRNMPSLRDTPETMG